MRIVTFGTYDKTTHPRIAILIEGLRAAGDKVTELNAPLGISTQSRVAMLQQPARVPLLLVKLSARWLDLIIGARRVRKTGTPDAVIVGYLGHFDVHLARLLFRRSPIILDQMVFAVETALDRNITRPWILKLLGWIDHRAVSAADAVLVDTPQRRALVQNSYRGQVVFVPVGAPQHWFAAGRARAAGPSETALRVVFFGLYTPLQGTTIIGDALSQLADVPAVQVTMIGTGQELKSAQEAARGNERVAWRGWLDANELVSVVADNDVCLGIFGDGPKARSVVPNKVYQGAAAGCAIVTSDTAPQRAALGDDAALFVRPGDSNSLAQALRMLAQDADTVARLQAAARRRAESHFQPFAIVQSLRGHLERPTANYQLSARE